MVLNVCFKNETGAVSSRFSCNSRMKTESLLAVNRAEVQEKVLKMLLGEFGNILYAKLKKIC